jgi:hypothetical protein
MHPGGDKRKLKERMSRIRDAYSLWLGEESPDERVSNKRDRFHREVLSREKVFGVSNELRIGAGAQLVNVHALALSFDGYPVGVYAVEHAIRRIGQGQYKA